MLWPSPEISEDLAVTCTSEGIELSASPGTEIFSWLKYYASTPKLKAELEQELVKLLISHLNHLERNHGKSKVSNRSTRTQNCREKDLPRQLKTNQVLSNFGKLFEEKV